MIGPCGVNGCVKSAVIGPCSVNACQTTCDWLSEKEIHLYVSKNIRLPFWCCFFQHIAIMQKPRNGQTAALNTFACCFCKFVARCHFFLLLVLLHMYFLHQFNVNVLCLSNVSLLWSVYLYMYLCMAKTNLSNLVALHQT